MTHHPSSPPPRRPEDLAQVARQSAHDSANWLAAAVGHLRRLEAGVDGLDREQALRGLRAALEACDELQATLADVARGGAAPEARTRTDLSRLVQAVVEAFASPPGQDLVVQAQLEPDVPVVVQPAAVRNAVANLLANAVAATSRGSVSVKVAREAGRASIRVRDTGPGMDPTTRARCLEEGFSTGGGSGLGLAQVRRTVRGHGGELEFTTAPGEGTEVRIQLPLASADPDRAADVLLVDDDPGVAEMLQDFFAEVGMACQHVWDGAAAEARFRADPTPVVLLDLRLPDGDGLDLAKRIRQVDPSVGIVLLTGERADLSIHADLVDAVLRKPVELEHLQRALTEARRRHDHRRRSSSHDDAEA